MKRLVFAGVLVVFLIISLPALVYSTEKPKPEGGLEGGIEQQLLVLAAVKDFVNYPTEDLAEFRKKLHLIESLAEKAEWKEIDEVSILLEKIKQEVEEKSREHSSSYLIVMHQECRPECSPEAKKKLEEIYQEWKFQQDARLGQFFYVIRAFQPRIAVLERKAEADKIRNSRLLRFVAEIKPEDSDEKVLEKRQRGIAEFEGRKGK
ncbi:MAG: hypothetical protein AAB926_01920 [Patescibacteria group bacterium]